MDAYVATCWFLTVLTIYFQALEKSKYEQSLDSVRRFISISEKELELYYRHVALYGDPNTRNADFVYGDVKENSQFRTAKVLHSTELGNAVSTSHESSVDSFISSTGEISIDQSDKDDFSLATNDTYADV